MCNGYNLYSSMAQFEKQHIYLYIKNKSIIYLRYIDNIFMVWKGTKQELLIFLENLNSKHKTIKFELNISQTEYKKHCYTETKFP